ncbi:MAG: cytochrome c assembly protein, partial [Saprospiraceae bacterium]|nr:cytochrome c assembly protein [Saprospiraceae bacterium]
PMMYVRPESGGFTNPAVVNQLEMKIRLTEPTLQAVFEAEEALKYTPFKIQQGDKFEYQGYQIEFASVIKNVDHPTYQPEEGDIAVAALLKITAPDGSKTETAPVYLIRNNTPFSLKTEAPGMGLHCRFEHIDPAAGLLTIGIAKTPATQKKIPFEVAENAPRTDYVVLEAIVFPGINLVWAGSILMLLGFAISLWRRWKE